MNYVRLTEGLKFARCGVLLYIYYVHSSSHFKFTCMMVKFPAQPECPGYCS